MKFRRLLAAILFVCLVSLSFGADGPGDSTRGIRVAVYRDTGVGKSVNDLLAVLKKIPELKVAEVKAADIQAGKLAGFDVVIHPGGSGGGQGRRLGEKGRERVRKFVAEGGGYVGFCAGAYLASNDYEWSLNLTDAKVLDRKHWARGKGKVQVELSPAGRQLLGYGKDEVTIYYAQGPLLAPKDDPKVPDFRALGTFKTEIAKNGAPKGVMKGTTAITANEFGKGRVFCFSPHPELTEGLESFVARAVAWAAGTKKPATDANQRE